MSFTEGVQSARGWGGGGGGGGGNPGNCVIATF